MHYGEMLMTGESEVCLERVGASLGKGWIVPGYPGDRTLVCPVLECFRHFEKAHREGRKDPKESHRTVMKASRATGLAYSRSRMICSKSGYRSLSAGSI